MHPAAPFFDSFVVPKKRHRYTELLSTTRGLEKVRLSLDHFKDLDTRFCHRVPSAQQHAAEILRALKGLGAPDTCYVMSSNGELDGREMNLSDALGAIVGRGMGSVVSCVPGVLGYFESEEAGERYICHLER
jgi:hypothetical protein